MVIDKCRLITEDLSRIFPKISKKLEALFGSSVLITGGAGFIGSWLAEVINHLNLTEKAEVKLYIIDRTPEHFTQRLPHLARSSYINVIRSDTRSLSEIPRDVNYVIHAAATPDTRFHASNPIETMTTIAEGTASVLHAACRASNLLKFVNVSSSAIYASNLSVEKISEDAVGLSLSAKSSAAYSEAKRYAETLCAAARSEGRIPVVTVRPFSFCGAYQPLDAPWVLNNFISDALHNRPIRILGDGSSVRSLMYGADLAYWLLVIMLHGNSGDVFNVGSDQAECVSDLARRVASNFSPTPNILTNTSLAGISERSRLVPDVSAAKSTFGLEIYTDIAHAILRTIDWHRAVLNTPN